MWQLELKELRSRARFALQNFLQGIVDHPPNAEYFSSAEDPERVPHQLWEEGLRVAYRLLFIVKLELTPRVPTFSSDPRWRSSYSPTYALAPAAQKGKKGLEQKLRETFSLFRDGEDQLGIPKLADSLFSADATSTIDALCWGDTATRQLLLALLGNFPKKSGGNCFTSVASLYQTLPPEALGWIYESLIELEPGLTKVAMCRIRHPRIEVVLPAEHARTHLERAALVEKSSIKLVEELPPHSFYLRTNLSRKSSGSYYTPHTLVEFLVRETLTPLLEESLDQENPRPGQVLDLRILDPAMGSGHFLVASSRFLGRKLIESCELCLSLAERCEMTAAEKNKACQFRQRVDEITTPSGMLTQWLSGESKARDKAETLARRLVLSKCLYGVDCNPLAVELAKLSLWLEAFVDGYPLPRLDHHILCSDSLTGPFRYHLETLPGSGLPLVPELCKKLRHYWDTQIEKVIGLHLPEERDPHLQTLKTLAALWSGGAMLDEEARSVDVAYLEALERLLDDHHCPSSQFIMKMQEVGSRGVAWELTFPEVFSDCYRDGKGAHDAGFDAVLGNPPWDKVLPLEREFFAGYDLAVLAVPTARERRPLYDKLRQDPKIRKAWRRYAEPYALTRRLVDSAYSWQVVDTSRGQQGQSNRRTGGHGDSYRYFVERSWVCLRKGGRLGMVLPNAVYGTQGATGIRRLLLHQSILELCLGFRNTKGVFNIGSGQRFCLVVSQKGQETRAFTACFGLEDPQELLDESWRSKAFEIELNILSRTSPGYLCFLEFSSRQELDVISRMQGTGILPLGDVLARKGISLYQEMNMTNDSRRFSRTSEVLRELGFPSSADPRQVPTSEELKRLGWLVVHEKGTFSSYYDLEKSQPRYVCHESQVLQGNPSPKPKALEASRYFRLAARATIHASEVRKSVFCLLPPGSVVGNSALTEISPGHRPTFEALIVLALCNSLPFNFVARLRLGTNLNQFLLHSLPFPELESHLESFCVHSALRLSCNHAQYKELWQNQLGDVWLEDGKKWSFPVVESEKARCSLLAALDAAIAGAYHLEREQYLTVCEAFDKGRGYSSTALKDKDFALSAFDELADVGLESFIRKYDPYHDVPRRDN